MRPAAVLLAATIVLLVYLALRLALLLAVLALDPHHLHQPILHRMEMRGGRGGRGRDPLLDVPVKGTHQLLVLGLGGTRWSGWQTQ